MTPPREGVSDRRTRRQVLTVLALPLLAATSAAGAQARAGFRAVAVDLSPLDRFGGRAASGLLGPALLAEMRKVFADLIAPGSAGAPVLTARIASVYFSPYDGGRTIDAFGRNDNIEGDGIVTNGRQVLSSTHVLTELPPSYSGSLVTSDLDIVRYQSIAYQFAYWLRREMGV